MRRLASALVLASTATKRAVRRLPRGYIGWAGHGNFGDDAMFAAAEHLEGERLEVLRGAALERRLERIGLSGGAFFARVVLGGGTLVNRNYLSIVEHCLARGLPMVALGTGVGSAGFSMAEEGVDPRWAEAFARFERVGVRGPVSREKLARAGFDRAEVVGDLALALTPPHPIADWAGRRFIVSHAPARAQADAEPMARAEMALVAAIRELASEGWQPIPVAFDRADETPLARLMAAAGFGGLAPRSPRRFADYCPIASQAALSVGIRLHSAVLAASCGVAPVLIGYRDKCRDFAASLEHEGMVVALEGIGADRLMAAVGDAVSSLEVTGRLLHRRCAHWRDSLWDFAKGSVSLR